MVSSSFLRLILISALLVLLTILLPAKALAHSITNFLGTQVLTSSQSDWPMFGYNPQHIGFNPYENTLSPANVSGLTLDWSYTTGGSNGGTSPAVVNGVVYIDFDVADVGTLFAIDATTGTLKWSYANASGHFTDTPAVVNGVVYVGSDNNTLYALDAATGTLKWSYVTGNYISSSPAVANGLVYIGSQNGTLYALDAATGTLKWSYATGHFIFSSPAVANGLVYLGAAQDKLYALDAVTGTLIWSYSMNILVSSPAVANGVVYVGTYDNKVNALNATTGTLLWSYDTGNSVRASPSVANGVVYISSQGSHPTLYALDTATGTLKWSYVTGLFFSDTAAVANGVVYVGSRDINPGLQNAALYALDAATGTLKWSYTHGNVISPPVVANGVVYSCSVDGILYAFHLPQLIQLSSDPYTNSTSQHKTEVEPDSFSFGSTIVAAFQVGRYADSSGGSENIGWATSTDGGTSWTPGLLSGITKIAGGTYDRVSDPSVAYDAKDNMWMIVSLGIVIHKGKVVGTAVLVSRSPDGLNWNAPVLVASSEFFDKSWIICDNTTSSSFYGHCYIEWDDAAEIAGGLIVMATSTDGGLKWVQNLTAHKAAGIGGQPLVQPNGIVIVPIDNAGQSQIEAFTSIDGGKKWSAPVVIASIQFHTPAGGLRASPLPSAGIDGSGTAYVVWSDCRFEPNCSANDLVISTSTNGINWLPAQLIPIESKGSGVDHFIPGLAVDSATSGSNAHLALTYYYYPTANCVMTSCDLDVGFVSSADGGNSWSSSVQMAGPMQLSWLPQSDLGPMVGDYISTSFSGSKAFPIFAVAKAPSGGLLNEAMYTVMGGV